MQKLIDASWTMVGVNISAGPTPGLPSGAVVSRDFRYKLMGRIALVNIIIKFKVKLKKLCLFYL